MKNRYNRGVPFGRPLGGPRNLFVFAKNGDVMLKFKIVADSSSNVFSLGERPYAVVPLKIRTDEREYVDDGRLDVAGMVNDLRHYKGKTATSCPNVAEWLEAFGDADEVVAISQTSGISGGYAAALQAAETYRTEVHPGARVAVLDTRSTGPELQVIIERICEWVDSGCTFDEIERRLPDYAAHTHLVFALASVENFARNGRVNPALAKIVGILGIRIFGCASPAGELHPLHKCRGEKQVFPVFLNEMKKMGYAGGRVRIAHTQNEAGARHLKELLRAEHPHCDVDICQNGGLCSYYCEPGGLLVGFEDGKGE